jgi:hypothetical protein
MIMGRIEIELTPAGDDAAEVALAGEFRAAAHRAAAQGRMTFVMEGGRTAGAFVPVGVAVAMDPGVVRMSGDTSWTELPPEGLFCPAGRKIDNVTWRKGVGRPEAQHDDGTMCTHTRSPVDEPVT